MPAPIVIDLYSPQYWLVVAAGVLLLSLGRVPRVRSWALAGLNLAFIALLLNGKVVPVLIALGIIALSLRFVSGRAGLALIALGAPALLWLFVLHKRPDWAALMGSSRVTPILVAVGFSYAALRLIDMVRAVREGRQPPSSLAGTINYLLPFHMLAAGPIQSYEAFVQQPALAKTLTVVDAVDAFDFIARGMFKKYVLAHLLQKGLLTGFHAGFPYTFLEMQLNFVWLYLDFSAYSEVALGVGRLMGVATPLNFDRPYLARNPIEFWERWHISLSQFIRNNIFFPLQLALMRQTSARYPLLVASVTFVVSFMLCAAWHSLTWPWFAWGALQVVALVSCNAYKQLLNKRLGRRGVKQYLEKRWLRWVAIAVTFEFEAFALLIVTYPFGTR